MPICEAKPWRRQYFDAHPCPADINIPTGDADAWAWNPAHRGVYDRLQLALGQGVAAAPHGVAPPYFPVFSKPIYKLTDAGGGARRLRSAADYAARLTDGHMWMALLRGARVSTDAALVDGEARWWRHATGIPGTAGGVDHWRIQAAPLPGLEQHLAEWAARHLAGYTGMVNFETVGNTITGAHLRFADQWPDLYGAGWVEALVGLYQRGRWLFDDAARRDGYSVELAVPAGTLWSPAPPAAVQAACDMPDIASVQMVVPPEDAPGAICLAVINCWDLAAGLAARERLQRHLRLQAPPGPPSSRPASPSAPVPATTSSA
ncbi:hypothetical protein [Desertibaculum subflavum]|uniref:hypothetical protein n=1 Tax=Desertibaculum subflavum TaxID=2268458 RepID=UPI000E65F116